MDSAAGAGAGATPRKLLEKYVGHEVELIEILEVERQPVIRHSELDRLERLVRLHRDLEISPQGLLAVDHLLERMEQLQEEVLELRRRLGRWE